MLLAVRLASLYLCTTVDSSMILQEGNLVRWVAMRAACEPTIIFPLNEIINAFVQSAGREAFGLDTAMPSFMERWSKLQEHADVSISDREALRLIRERAYQRVTLRVHLEGMDLAETSAYVKHHLALAGRSDTLFSDDALAVIQQASRGLPRAVNNLALQALVATFAQDKSIVDESAAKMAVVEVVEQ